MSDSRGSGPHSPDSYESGVSGGGGYGAGRSRPEDFTTPPAPSLLGWIVFWAVWWILLLGLWVLLTNDVAVPELAAGAVAAAAGATMAAGVRSQRLTYFRPRLRWALGLWRLPLQVALDTGLLIAALWHRLVMRQPVRGSFRAIPFRQTVGEEPEANARRAIAVTVGSFAPNTYVVDIDQERELILVHQLVPKPGDSKSIDPLGLR